MEEALKLFFSYSHKDEALRDELGNHLKILEHQQLIASWHDRKILPGDEWDHQITVNQDTADIILLLISSDFIASKYCWDIEIKRAMELHDSGKACVIPVILRRADWRGAPFSKLQAVPKNAQPVTSFSDRDEAFEFVTQQIRQVVEGLIEHRRKLREQQQKDIAIALYRQRFEKFAADGEISLGEQFLLDELQQELGLTDAEVQAIKQGILNPVANPQQLERYRQLLMKAIAQYGYPFNDKVRADLKLVQTHLKLSDTNIAQVEAPIIAQKVAEQQEQQRQPEALKQQSLEQQNAADLNLGQPSSPSRFVDHAGSEVGTAELDSLADLFKGEVPDLGMTWQAEALKQQSLKQQSAAVLKHEPIAQESITDDLSSERGIDYTLLRDLLKAQRWQEADQETYKVMIRAVGKNEGDWFDPDELLNFPCTDLKTIDSLWVKYSNGKFGFSVQKEIYLECGGLPDGQYHREAFKKFGDRVGWRKNKQWVRVTYSTSSGERGYLPSYWWLWVGKGGIGYSSLASRLVNCSR
ncbi:GUN4 domain-containing protein [Oculatella sp. FACHB-28]|uniref:GUN4 domain-containing protein n=1 Tax=Oculatella sp. FACHB-28 TaxID=2692845 RepID=UPI001688534C|nr:GUN4 domain-containing protein [Oculatella sp. FACHB-28]